MTVSSILGHTLWLDANEYLPLDADSIPVGEVSSVHGTTFDFTTPKTIGQDFLGDEQQRLSLGYDHPFLIKGDPLSPFAAVTSEDGRVKMQMFTDYPAVQFYSGNYLNLQHAKVIARDDGKIYFNQSGFCLEPEYYPDSPHLSEFAVLNPTVTPQRPLDHFIAWQFDV